MKRGKDGWGFEFVGNDDEATFSGSFDGCVARRLKYFCYTAKKEFQFERKDSRKSSGVCVRVSEINLLPMQKENLKRQVFTNFDCKNLLKPGLLISSGEGGGRTDCQGPARQKLLRGLKVN